MMPENLANLPNVWRERKVDDRPMAAFKWPAFNGVKLSKQNRQDEIYHDFSCSFVCIK